MTTDITTRPIIFSGEMVSAILDGRKTQTRLVVKPQPIGNEYYITESPTWRNGNPNAGELYPNGTWGFRRLSPTGFWGCMFQCPYGQTGDRLWVRETWRPWNRVGGGQGVIYAADNQVVSVELPHDLWTIDRVNKWRPSVHMSRWASRITLDVTDVRVERVAEISEEDAVAEDYGFDSPLFDEDEAMNLDPSDGFRRFWDSIHAKRGFGWDSNPWVWVVSFSRVTA